MCAPPTHLHALIHTLMHTGMYSHPQGMHFRTLACTTSTPTFAVLVSFPLLLTEAARGRKGSINPNRLAFLGYHLPCGKPRWQSREAAGQATLTVKSKEK